MLFQELYSVPILTPVHLPDVHTTSMLEAKSSIISKLEMGFSGVPPSLESIVSSSFCHFCLNSTGMSYEQNKNYYNYRANSVIIYTTVYVRCTSRNSAGLGSRSGGGKSASGASLHAVIIASSLPSSSSLCSSSAPPIRRPLKNT